MLRLALDDAARIRGLRARRLHQAQHVGCGGQRGKRVAQLVAQHGEEFVFRAIRIPERSLGLLARGDVAHDPDEPAPLSDANLAHRDIDRKDRAVVAPAFHFAPDADDDRLAGLQVAGEAGVVVRAVGLRHQLLDVLAERFGALVAEDPAGRRIEGFDRAALVDRDDSVEHVIHHGAFAIFCRPSHRASGGHQRALQLAQLADGGDFDVARFSARHGLRRAGERRDRARHAAAHEKRRPDREEDGERRAETQRRQRLAQRREGSRFAHRQGRRPAGQPGLRKDVIDGIALGVPADAGSIVRRRDLPGEVRSQRFADAGLSSADLRNRDSPAIDDGQRRIGGWALLR